MNRLVDNQRGMALHNNKTRIEIVNPIDVPKKSLKIAPVYPIIAETSNCSKIKMRDKSIGLNAVTTIIAFSNG